MKRWGRDKECTDNEKEEQTKVCDRKEKMNRDNSNQTKVKGTEKRRKGRMTCIKGPRKEGGNEGKTD